MKLLNEKSRTTKILERILLPAEKISKEVAFDCRMCGRCILHETGLTCPMRCPKNERNGPCGGVRPNGNCEVYPDKPCVWVQAVERAPRLPLWCDHIQYLQSLAASAADGENHARPGRATERSQTHRAAARFSRRGRKSFRPSTGLARAAIGEESRSRRGFHPAAEFMRTRVPGVVIPDSIIERLKKMPRERWQEEGIEICVEIIQQVREIEGVAGVHVMAYRQEHVVAEIVHRAGLFPRISPATIEAQKRSAYAPLA